MKNQKGITVIMLIIIIAIIAVIIGIIVAFTNNQGNATANIKWGYMPSSAYYELRLAATTSEVNGSGKGTLSLSSFNTLGRDVKDAKGKWFESSNVNFKASVSDVNGKEVTTLSDGKNTATFTFIDGSDYVSYSFKGGDHTGYRITIK